MALTNKELLDMEEKLKEAFGLASIYCEREKNRWEPEAFVGPATVLATTSQALLAVNQEIKRRKLG